MKPAAPVTRYRIAESLGERQDRLERAVPVRSQADLGEVARHGDALDEVAEARLGSLAARECERELGVAAARGERDGEPAAEAGVDVGDRQGAARLAEALDIRRAFDADRLGYSRAV